MIRNHILAELFIQSKKPLTAPFLPSIVRIKKSIDGYFENLV